MSLLKRRVLVLHGWSQNGQMFKKRLAPFCTECEVKGIELVFLDGPRRVNVDDIVDAWTRIPEFAPDMGYDRDSPEIREWLREADPRSWWQQNPERTIAQGLEETLELVKGALEKQSFDGIMGFSQGAALAAIIATILERPHLYPSFMCDGKSVHPPLHFCLAFCGYRLTDPVAEKIFEASYRTLTLHVLGREDTSIEMSRSRPLVDLGQRKCVIIHEGGHIVPLTTSWIAFYCNWIKNPSLEVTLPTASCVRLEL